MQEIESRIIGRTGGLAAWSIRHPVGVSMIAAAVLVLGLFALGKLAIDLLPHIIYPEIRVRILDPGVSATVMEDRVTRQLEEQLAITEDAVAVESDTTQGMSTVNLSFQYGKDIDIALSDASTRLDRAKRFLPSTINPPIIYKLDPSQIAVMEIVVSSPSLDGVAMRSYVDDVLRKWFLNLPGVAAAEVGGGLTREIHVLPDQQRLAGVGLNMEDIKEALQRGNREDPAGRLRMSTQQITGRISGRLDTVEKIENLPLRLKNGSIRLSEVAKIIDTHEDERLRVRANGVLGVKLSIQKQPNANTVEVVDVVKQRIAWLKEKSLIPEDIELTTISDQSIYVRHALNNSSLAAISGALLAMTVVYLFLGSLRRTLIIGSAIPIAIMVTFVLMGLGNLTLNIMTLGGLALGIGMLVDNTIVMLENINRHQRQQQNMKLAGVEAAAEVNSAIVASTSTNLSAVLPFLFIGGLTGLLFRELIFTISAAIVASMVIALTLVPAWACRSPVQKTSRMRRLIDSKMEHIQSKYANLIEKLIHKTTLLPLIFIILLMLSLPTFLTGKEIFLPKFDDGLVTVRISTDPGTTLEEMDLSVKLIENLFRQQKQTESVYSLVGGSIFGRTERETPNKSFMTVQLVPQNQRAMTTQAFIKDMGRKIAEQRLAGVKVRMLQRGVRGIRTSRGDDDISIRVQGPELPVLESIAEQLVLQLSQVNGLRNIESSSEEVHFELSIELDRDRATALGLEVEDVTEAMQIALDGILVTEFVQGDRAFGIRLRLPNTEANNPQDLQSILLFPATQGRPPVYLGNVAKIELVRSPANIKRDNQIRIVEVSASASEGTTLGEILNEVDALIAAMQLPNGYTVYEGGSKATLQEGKRMAYVLLALALFLVFVVMAVQYESLRDPMVIISCVPFMTIGVAGGIYLFGLQISMPVWLGMIMLAGIVVNNAIVMVEYIEISRQRGLQRDAAIVESARLRLRPILMTTLTTVVGMLPLAIGIGEGSEMLQPLAVTMVCGLSFSMLVSLILLPIVYRLYHFHRPEAKTA